MCPLQSEGAFAKTVMLRIHLHEIGMEMDRDFAEMNTNEIYKFSCELSAHSTGYEVLRNLRNRTPIPVGLALLCSDAKFVQAT